MEVVGNKSTMVLNKDGKLTLSTSIPSLEGYKQNLELGVDKATGLPYIGASISYEFYKYKLQTPLGELILNGTASLKNTFSPKIKPGQCESLVPAYRDMMDVRAQKEVCVMQAAGVIALGGTGFIYGGALSGLGASLIPVSIETATASENQDLSDYKNKIKSTSEDRTISVIFFAHPIREG